MRGAGGLCSDCAGPTLGGSSTENLRQNRDFYAAGTSSLTELLDAETLYARSRDEMTSACAAYRTSLARYMRVTGR
mgnify:CR=1 FL=1